MKKYEIKLGVKDMRKILTICKGFEELCDYITKADPLSMTALVDLKNMVEDYNNKLGVK